MVACIRDGKRSHNWLVAAGLGGLLLGLAGCSSPAAPYLAMEMKLSEAGFVAHPADTTARYAMLNTLPPGELTYRPSAAGRVYVYADPIGCGCVYMGSESAYNALTMNEAARQKNRRKPVSTVPVIPAMAAENRRDTAIWDWSAWSVNADPGANQPRHVIGGFW